MTSQIQSFSYYLLGCHVRTHHIAAFYVQNEIDLLSILYELYNFKAHALKRKTCPGDRNHLLSS